MSKKKITKKDEKTLLKSYANREISEYQLQQALGLTSRFALHKVLYENKIPFYTVKDFRDDMKTLERLKKTR